MSTQTTEQKVEAGRYGSAIKADASKTLPPKIEVMRAGTWPETSNKGALWITPDDLQMFCDNFHAGIGIPGGADFGQLPIDFKHEDYAEAAGWITDLTVEGIVLYATVEWTQAGEAALKGGMYKCFSPSFWPACLGEWYDSEDYSKTAKNVLVGGALTNIPFFKDLTAIMASNAGNSKDRKKINAHKENVVPTIEEVRIKDVASLTPEDKQVLADNRKELSEAEDKKFFPDDHKDANVNADNKPVTGLNEEDAKLLASVKSGEMKLVKAADYDSMKTQVDASAKQLETMRESAVQASVTEHAKRGAIKADQIPAWTKRIMADATMEDDLKNLPDNKTVGGEIGSENAKEVNASDEFAKKVDAKMTASGGKLTYSEAVVQCANEDAALANQHESQTKA